MKSDTQIGSVAASSMWHLHPRWERVEADLGGKEICLFDTVTNAGFDRTPYVLRYHINLGWPLLDEGSRFIAPIGRTLCCYSERGGAARVLLANAGPTTGIRRAGVRPRTAGRRRRSAVDCSRI